MYYLAPHTPLSYVPQVEIASRLTFNEKTVIRLFVGYYRKSVDKLDVTESDRKNERYHIVRWVKRGQGPCMTHELLSPRCHTT